MPEAHDDMKKLRQGRPRLLTWRTGACLLGFAAAGWIWLGSGFCWDATPKALAEPREAPRVAMNWRGRGGWVGRYVRVRAEAASGTRFVSPRLQYLRQIERREWLRVGAGPGPASSGPPPSRLHIVEFQDRVQRGGVGYDVYALVEGFDERAPVRVRGRVTVQKLSVRPGVAFKGGPPPDVMGIVVDATAGRLNGTALIAVVLAFWSSVFLQLEVVEWVRVRRRWEHERAELMRRAEGA